jgi:hypothetical protein
MSHKYCSLELGEINSDPSDIQSYLIKRGFINSNLSYEVRKIRILYLQKTN